MKKIIFLVVVILFLINLTACNLFSEDKIDEQRNYVFLGIEKSHKYGTTILKPGKAGNYAYTKGAVVEIKLKDTAGYTFKGWKGINGNEVQKAGKDSWKILMNDNKKITADYDFEEFLIINTKPAVSAENVSYNQKQIEIYFNNDLGISDASNVNVLDNEGHKLEGIESEVKENKIKLELNDYLDFEKTYNVVFEDGIWDKDNRLINPDDFSFKVETDSYSPLKVYSIGVKVKPDSVQLEWEKTPDRPEAVFNKYAFKYNIYRSEDGIKFHKLAEKSDPDYEEWKKGSGHLSYVDTEVDLANNRYYYKITAVDAAGNESEKSSSVKAAKN